MNTIKNQASRNPQGLCGCIMFFVAAICILSFSSASSKGAFEGLKICSNIIIPSIFPFTVLSILFQKSGGLLYVGKLLNRLTFFLFKMGGVEFSVILLSLVGGYPVGGKIINELYKSGSISKAKAKKLLRFCINPSPAFFISALGVNILKNKITGCILLASNTVACFVLNLFFGRDKLSDKQLEEIYQVQSQTFSDAFVESVFEGAKITLNICAFVSLFSSLAEMIKPLFYSPQLYAIFCPILEISFGISKIKNSGLQTHFYSFLLAFGGISTICQIKQATDSLKPSFREIFGFRIIHGAFATLISFVLFKCFPQSVTVFSNGADITFSGYTLFFPSIMLMIFSVLFLMFLSPQNKQIDTRKNKKYNFYR